jgi:pilus assembly protein CpaE
MARTSQSGQASVEMVAVVPFVLLVGLVLWQLVLAGHTLWMAGNAARVAARAEAVGSDAERAARTALPDALERGMQVSEAGSSAGVEVRLQVPFVLPRWQTPIPVAASANLEPGA